MELNADLFWERFEEIRKKLDLKMSTVESMCGFAARRISWLKSQSKLPTIDELKSICNVLNVPYEFLLDGVIKSSKLNEMVILYTRYQKANTSVQIVINQLLDLDSLNILSSKDSN